MSRIDLYPTKNAGPSQAQVQTGTEVTGDKVAGDVYVQGGVVSASPSGLRIAFLPTTLNVTDVATALPASPLADRNAMTITNKGADSVWIGNADVTADSVVGTTSGVELGVGESFNIDITDDILLYARAEAGKTVKVQVVEVS